jgi:N-methylhydantoinase A
VSATAAIDVGGTFTDVTIRRADGALHFAKVPTTQAALHEGIFSGLTQAATDIGALERVVHGSTIVINTIIERKGARTALVTTKGFADVLEIARGNRPDMYNFRYEKPIPFVPRELCFEVDERVDAAGHVVTPLNRDSLEATVEAIRDSHVEAVAVCTLHSYANPQHEYAVANHIRSILPHVIVSASHEISGMWREYERACTTALNAFARPPIDDYLTELASELAAQSFTGHVGLVQSTGGLTDVTDARLRPVTLLESGPVAGVSGFAHLGAELGHHNIISLDVGGTTAKCAVVQEGRLPVTDDYAIERTPRSPGYPVQVPTVDIVEIGSGGGSLARAGRDGGVSVGPESAGAAPGPACYGWGGSEPTVTDAALVAGWLNPDYFLGGRMPLRPELAHQALSGVANAMGVRVDEAAAGVLRLAHENFAAALRLVTLERGHDPRDFVLGACGGAGPMHAALLARDLGIPRVLVPISPGTFSSWAMVLLEPRADAVVTKVVDLHALDDAGVFDGLRRTAEERLGAGSRHIDRVVAMRYRGQEYTLDVVVPEDADAEALEEQFHELHLARFGFAIRESDIECVHFHVAVRGERPDSAAPRLPGKKEAEPAGVRTLSLLDEELQQVPIYLRSYLGSGFSFDGPAVVEEETATTIVPPDAKAVVDVSGNLLIDVGS